MITAVIAIAPTVAYAMGPNYVLFDNIGQYIAFENRMKDRLNMPITPVNYETGLPAIGKQVTTDYTLPQFHEDKVDVRILVSIDKHAALQGLERAIDKAAAVSNGWVFKGGNEDGI